MPGGSRKDAAAVAVDDPREGRPPARRLGGPWPMLEVALGPALELTALLLVLLFLRSELGYDRFHRHADRIVRLSQVVAVQGEKTLHTPLTPLILAAGFQRDFPPAAEVVRVMPYLEGIVPGRVAVRYGAERQFYERFAWVDAGFLRLFTLPLVAGSPGTALGEPNSVLLSESAARRYFGGAPALGRVLRIDSGYSDESYKVTGVFRDLPYDSHFHFDLFAPFSSLDHVKDPRIVRDNWYVLDTYTYLLLAPGVPAERVAAGLPAFVARHYPPVPGYRASLELQPLGDIHLRSHQTGEPETNGDLSQVRAAAAIALVLLLLAVFDFAVLSAGGPRGRLVPALVTVALAAVLARLALPVLDALTDEPIGFPYTPGAVLALIVLALLLTAAGVVGASRGASRGGVRGRTLPRALAVVHLALFAGLLAGALGVRGQVRFLRGHDLGFDPRDVLVVPVRDQALRDHFPVLKAAMERNPNVLGTTFSSLVMGQEGPQISTQIAGARDNKNMSTMIMDYDFLKVFHLALAAGRPLSRQQPKDLAAGFLINEAAVPFWGLGSPQKAIGKAVSWNGTKEGKIVGVLRDFHERPLQFPVEPLILHIRPLTFRYLYVKLAPHDVAGTIRALGATWHTLAPDKPFAWSLLAKEYDRAYEGEEHLASLLAHGALLALVLAVLFLLGIARTSAREATVLAGLAILIGLPAAYELLARWLGGFAYRTPLGPLDFLLSALAVLAAAWLIAGIRSGIRAWRSGRDAGTPNAAPP